MENKFFKVFNYVALLLLPALAVLLIISSHSFLLITKPISLAIFIAFAVLLLYMVGFAIYKNRNGMKFLKKTWARVLVIIYMILCLAFVFVLYGPWGGFRNWLVTTAMATMRHQDYCKWFYSDEEINDILSQNYVLEVDEETDTDLINGNFEKSKIRNEYDRQILTRENDQPYKVIKLKINGQNAYLAAVYDPSKVIATYTAKLGVTGQYVTRMAENEEALLGINGAGFYDPGANSSGSTPGGLTISRGKVITDNGFAGYTGGGLVGFNKNNVLVLMKNATAESALKAGVRDAMSWGPFLVVNGKASYVSGNGGWGYAARTAIGQRADGIVLLLVVDSNSSRSKGADMADLAEVMVNYGAVNAANLDGGTSTVMVLPKDEALAINPDAKTDGYSHKYYIINDPIDSTLSHKTRPIASAFVVLK